jgi:hypothetical protein
MKLRNKKTGEIKEWGFAMLQNVAQTTERRHYNSLAELNAEWEDTPEEPKEHWCITMYGGITRIKDDEEPIDDLIEIGNYFNSKEDAYDAWDKLKAWKRLKDKGFRFLCWNVDYTIDFTINGQNTDNRIKEYNEVLDLLFSGGEE